MHKLLALFLAMASGTFLGQGAADADEFASPRAEALYKAAARNQLGTARELIAQGADLESANEREYTLLLVAMVRKDRRAFENLLELGADPTALGDRRDTAMHVAAWNRDTWWLETMLAHGASVEARNVLGETPLFAALGKSNRATEVLLAAGADIHARASNGDTLVMHAANRSAYAEVLRFLELGVDPLATDHLGHTFQKSFFLTPEKGLGPRVLAIREQVRQWLREHGIPVDDRRR